MSKVFRFSWVVIAIVSAFVLGLKFQPGEAQRMPPRLTPQMMQPRMPQNIPAGMNGQLPPPDYRVPSQQSR